MPLDGYMYDKDNKEIDYFPIDESLHEAIFAKNSKLYMSYTSLRKLRDYYKDVKFIGDEVYQLEVDLKRYKEFIKKDQHKKVDTLIKKLSNLDLAKVAFYAD
ncbi:hypothetical protein J7E63_16015 [Bacillus sp. ISL-75]|uniref:hypothetical protein n=1 Tax=Bacillus sp. ISL-75 TaxID=2819137 RepID=UPI001BEA2BE8|nr:hypothetical protein [Bacillus sp. ISL-75]MBT2728434.1 hypothetical protein [Bacillus sp. ISL-75]